MKILKYLVVTVLILLLLNGCDLFKDDREKAEDEVALVMKDNFKSSDIYATYIAPKDTKYEKCSYGAILDPAMKGIYKGSITIACYQKNPDYDSASYTGNLVLEASVSVETYDNGKFLVKATPLKITNI